MKRVTAGSDFALLHDYSVLSSLELEHRGERSQQPNLRGASQAAFCLPLLPIKCNVRVCSPEAAADFLQEPLVPGSFLRDL